MTATSGNDHNSGTAVRREFARELHDQVVPQVTAMVLRAEELRTRTPLPTDVREELGTIAAAGRHAVEDLRMILINLRGDRSAGPLKPDAQLAQATDRLSEAGFRPDLSVSGDLTRLPRNVGVVLFGCLLEGVNNIIVHGRRDAECRIHIERTAGSVELAAINAIGTTSPTAMGGLGLVGMKDRVASVNGTISVGTVPHGRWLLDVCLPIHPGAD